MIKKIFGVMTILIITICLIGCSSSGTDLNLKIPKYGIQQDDEFRVWNIEETDNGLPFEGKDVSIDIENEIDSYANQIVEYIEQEYNIIWIYESIQVMSADFSNTKFYAYNALYIPKTGIIYINENNKYIDSKDLKYIYVHELIHYLRDINVGTCNFYFPEYDGLGKYTMEALTDLLTIKIFGTEEAKEFFLTKSSYSYSIVGMEILELAIPELLEYYLKDDMKSLENEYNTLSEKYVDMISVGVTNPFMNFLDVVDATQIAYNNLVLSKTINDYANFNKYSDLYLKYWIGQYELALYECRGLDNNAKKEAITFYEEFLKIELGESSYLLEYLDSCLK